MTPQRLSAARPLVEQAVEARVALRLAAAVNERAEAAPHDVAERLRVAREQALARAREVRVVAARPAPTRGAVVLGRPGGAAALGVFGGPVGLWQRAASLLPLVMLVLGLMFVDRFTVQEQVSAAAQIDAELLADDLPPDAYSDPGFAEFLRSAPP